MEIRIRIVQETERDYIIYSAQEAEKIAKYAEENLSNTDLIDPEKSETLQIDQDDSYSFVSLYKDICHAIGVRPRFAIDTDDNPALFYMLIELDDKILIKIEDYNVLLSKVLENFHPDSMTVYCQFIFGRGELFRGDGIKMHMIKEQGVQHKGAHVHVDGKDGRAATISIDDRDKYNGNLNKSEKKAAKRVIKDNKKGRNVGPGPGNSF